MTWRRATGHPTVSATFEKNNRWSQILTVIDECREPSKRSASACRPRDSMPEAILASSRRRTSRNCNTCHRTSDRPHLRNEATWLSRTGSSKRAIRTRERENSPKFWLSSVRRTVVLQKGDLNERPRSVARVRIARRRPVCTQTVCFRVVWLRVSSPTPRARPFERTNVSGGTSKAKISLYLP